MELLYEFRFIIVLVAAGIIFALLEREKFIRLATQLMLVAKSLAKDTVLNSGEAQEQWVLDKLYIYLPKWITFFIPHEVMRKLIKYIYHMAKDYLDDGKINNSI